VEAGLRDDVNDAAAALLFEGRYGGVGEVDGAEGVDLEGAFVLYGICVLY
jgi:hypothetical protein